MNEPVIVLKTTKVLLGLEKSMILIQISQLDLLKVVIEKDGI
jgi:hypothetical protein